MIHDPSNHMIDHLLEGLGLMIKPGTGREDGGPGLAELKHVLQMKAAEGGLSGDQDQRAFLLQGHIGRTVDEIVPNPVADGRQAGHGAGADHHALMLPGTAGRRRTHVLAIMKDHAWQGKAGQIPVSFKVENGLCSRGYNKMGLNLVMRDKGAQQGQGVLDAAGPGYGQHNAQRAT